MAEQKHLARGFSTLSRAQASFWVVVFVMFWTVMISILDMMAIIVPVTQQIVTYSFQSTPGVIKDSKVIVKHGDKGNIFSIDVSYEYAIDGKEFVNDRLRYGSFDSNDSYAKQFVAAHPAGSPTEVFFNSKNPQDSVLVRGIEGADLFIAIFLLPFNIVLFLGWYLVISSFHYRRNCSEGTHSLCISGIQQTTNKRFDLIIGSSWGAGLIVAILISFASVFIIGFSVGSHPSLKMPLIAWIVIVGTASLVVKFYPRSTSDRWRYGVIDRSDLVLRLFKMGRWSKIAEYSFEEVTAVEVRESSDQPTPDGDGKVYQLRVHRYSGDDELVTEFRDENELRWNAKTLSEELKVEIKGIADKE